MVRGEAIIGFSKEYFICRVSFDWRRSEDKQLAL